MIKSILWFALGFAFASILRNPVKSITNSASGHKNGPTPPGGDRKVKHKTKRFRQGRHHDILFQQFTL